MDEKKLNDILKNGIYGKPEIKPEERRLFLSSLAERVYLGLTKSQVRTKGIYKEAEDLMKKHNDITLFINGTLSYPYYSNYIRAASSHHVPFTIINDGHDTPLGIVIAANTAINKEETMFLKDTLFEYDMGEI